MIAFIQYQLLSIRYIPGTGLDSGHTTVSEKAHGFCLPGAYRQTRRKDLNTSMYNYKCDNSSEGKAEYIQKACNKEPSLRAKVRESLFGNMTLKLRPKGSVVSQVKREACLWLGGSTPGHPPYSPVGKVLSLVAMLPRKDKNSLTQPESEQNQKKEGTGGEGEPRGMAGEP